MKFALLFLFAFCAFGAFGIGLTPEKLQFRYEEIGAKSRVTECSHSKASVGLFEWDVVCQVDGKKHEYAVHLVVSFYPKTIHGTSAYEVLYWVTDFTNPKVTGHDSSTMWIHNSEDLNRVKVFELSQGIEDDLSYLRLTVKP